MADQGKRIAVFGAGYVGLVTGACFAELGHRVTVRDVVAEKVEQLRRGEVPIYEPGLEELIARNAERLSFTTDVDEAIDDAEFVYVAVGASGVSVVRLVNAPSTVMAAATPRLVKPRAA